MRIAVGATIAAVVLLWAFVASASPCAGLAGLALAECQHLEQSARRAAAERERANLPREIAAPLPAETPCGLPPRPGDVGAWTAYGECVERETARARARDAKASAPKATPPPHRETVCTTDVLRHGGWNRNETWTTRCR